MVHPYHENVFIGCPQGGGSDHESDIGLGSLTGDSYGVLPVWLLSGLLLIELPHQFRPRRITAKAMANEKEIFF